MVGEVKLLGIFFSVLDKITSSTSGWLTKENVA